MLSKIRNSSEETFANAGVNTADLSCFYVKLAAYFQKFRNQSRLDRKLIPECSRGCLRRMKPRNMTMSLMTLEIGAARFIIHLD